MREWQDIYTQLRQVVKELGLPINSEPAEYREIHTALLTGLLSHIGMKDNDKQEFTGARNARFSIFPGSGLFKKPPKWTMVAELVETSRLWGRIAARIDPEWIEPVAQHLLKRSYSEPHWERAQGAVMATEKVTVYGLPIVAARKVNYSQIDPALCRELFIRHALVEGTGRRVTPSSATTSGCVRKSKSWSINRAAATFWWMTIRCSISTTSVSATM